jgi:CheY-like chemotaxis protein
LFRFHGLLLNPVTTGINAMYRKPWKRHYLSPGKTAEIFKVTPASLRGWTNKGIIRAETTQGGHRRYPLSEVFRLAQYKGVDLERSLFSSIKLLIIDSELEHGREVRESLKSITGIAEVEVALEGFMAGCMLTQFKPDVVLLDLEMPGIDSGHVCDYIKHDYQTRFIRVIAMCRNCTQQQQRMIMDLGAEACLSKPFSIENLKQVIGLIDPYN